MEIRQPVEMEAARPAVDDSALSSSSRKECDSMYVGSNGDGSNCSSGNWVDGGEVDEVDVLARIEQLSIVEDKNTIHYSSAEPRQHRILFSREECEYASHYCEENVYKLAERFNQHPEVTMANYINEDGRNVKYKGYAVFLSSLEKAVPIWNQKLGSGDDGLVVWDYHVVFLVKAIEAGETSQSSFIFDFDTKLPFCSRAEDYVSNSFPAANMATLPARHIPVSFRSPDILTLVHHTAKCGSCSEW
jgi:hypothetical protein